jgi:hypothetical protein
MLLLLILIEGTGDKGKTLNVQRSMAEREKSGKKTLNPEQRILKA